MPFQKNGVRQYDRELAWEKRNGKKRQNERAMRNAARAAVAKKKGVKATSIKGDVGHKKAVSRGGNNGLANLFVQDPGANRSFRRNKNGSMKSEKSKRES